MSGARLTGPYPEPDRGAVLLGDGVEIGGDLEVRESGRGPLVCHGQLRLVDAHVRGSASLSGVRLIAPDRDALDGDRLRVGGELYLRGIHRAGTLRLQNAEIGATLDCTGATFSRPRFRPWPDGPPQVRPSLDARAASVGKDLLLLRVRAPGSSPDPADGRGEVGAGGRGVAGRAGGALRPQRQRADHRRARGRSGRDPRGTVRPERVGAFRDSSMLWLARSAKGSALFDGFAYATLNDTRVVDVHKRLHCIVRVSGRYSPQYCDQLAAAYQRGGRDEMAELVFIERQHRRYAAAGRTARIRGPLQRYAVGYGNHPWLAVCWSIGLWLLGSA